MIKIQYEIFVHKKVENLIPMRLSKVAKFFFFNLRSGDISKLCSDGHLSENNQASQNQIKIQMFKFQVKNIIITSRILIYKTKQ